MHKTSIDQDFLLESTYANTRLPTEEAFSIIPSAYYDDVFFRLEKEQVFKRNWVVAGPAEKVQNTGDIMLTEVSGQNIIITRDEDGALRAFYNVCRHRGSRLCTEEKSIGKQIICPYHSWGYNLKGECIGTPYFSKGAKRKEIAMMSTAHLVNFDKKAFSLFSVRVQQWGMLIFVCLDEHAPDLEEYCGDLSARMRNYDLSEWKVLKEKKYEINCNWKLLLENAIEYYHLPSVHPRLAKTSRVIDHYRWQGDGMYCGICTTPITVADDAQGWLALRKYSKLNETESVSAFFWCTFPNVIIFVMPSHAFIIKAHPVSPTKTIETTWLMSHPESFQNATEEDINDVHEFWDEVNKEDIGICEEVQVGLTTDAYPGGRMCFQFEEPVHRFQNMVIDSMVGQRRIPPGDPKS